MLIKLDQFCEHGSSAHSSMPLNILFAPQAVVTLALCCCHSSTCKLVKTTTFHGLSSSDPNGVFSRLPAVLHNALHGRGSFMDESTTCRYLNNPTSTLAFSEHGSNAHSSTARNILFAPSGCAAIAHPLAKQLSPPPSTASSTRFA